MGTFTRLFAGNATSFETDGEPSSNSKVTRAVPANADLPENDAEVAAAFAAGGPLSRLLPGYRERQQQVAMAQAVAHHGLGVVGARVRALADAAGKASIDKARLPERFEHSH